MKEKYKVVTLIGKGMDIKGFSHFYDAKKAAKLSGGKVLTLAEYPRYIRKITSPNIP